VLNKEIYGQLEDDFSSFKKVANNLIQKVNSQKLTKDDLKKRLKAWRSLKFKTQGILKSVKQLSDETNEEYQLLLSQSITSFIIKSGIVSFILIVLITGLMRNIINRIKSLALEVKSILSSNDLSSRTIIGHHDEISEIKSTINLLLDNASQATNNAIESSYETEKHMDKVLIEQEQNKLIASLTELSITNSNNNIELVQNGLASNKDYLDEINQLNSQADKNIDDLSKQSIEVANAVEGINTLGSKSETNSHELYKQMEEIDNVITLIRNISEQTNLLALNAAIEAARAGVHGRGFAVVADEVRQLSANTQKATQVIEKNINQLKMNAEEMVSDSHDINEASENSIQILDEFKKSFVSLKERVQIIAENTQNATHQIYLNSAKLDHVKFKQDGYKSVILNQVDTNLSDHTNCKFGKWYASDGKVFFGHQSNYSLLEKPHTQVHNRIKHVIEIAKSDNLINKNDEIVSSFELAERASVELFELMDHLTKKEKFKI
jgi:methyl-accepting chemotaxis protein